MPLSPLLNPDDNICSLPGNKARKGNGGGETGRALQGEAGAQGTRCTEKGSLELKGPEWEFVWCGRSPVVR